MSLPVAVVVAVLGELVLHWFPWRMLLGRDLPRLVAYVLGVLAFALPWSFTGVEQGALVAFWVCTAAAGLAVGLAWAVDWVLNRVRLSYERDELEGKK